LPAPDRSPHLVSVQKVQRGAMCPKGTTKLAEPDGEELKKMFTAHVQQPVYAGHWQSSLLVAVNTVVVWLALWGAAAYTAQHGLLSWSVKVPLIAVWACMHVRSFIIYHDCGHKSFVQGFEGAPAWNNACMYLFAFLSGCTPTDWAIGHALHHNHVGNLDQMEYEWS
jgi:omega-6 fatty acid desaturase (delta-12 desaturase)